MTFYFNSYDVGTAWNGTPEAMVDGSEATVALAQGGIASPQTQLCDGNNSSDQGGTIVAVEIRGLVRGPGSPIGFDLIPVFGGSSDGDTHDLLPVINALVWSSYFDITGDTNAPVTWSWADVANLDCKIIFTRNAASGPNDFVNCAEIEIRVTYA